MLSRLPNANGQREIKRDKNRPLMTDYAHSKIRFLVKPIDTLPDPLDTKVWLVALSSLPRLSQGCGPPRLNIALG